MHEWGGCSTRLIVSQSRQIKQSRYGVTLTCINVYFLQQMFHLNIITLFLLAYRTADCSEDTE